MDVPREPRSIANSWANYVWSENELDLARCVDKDRVLPIGDGLDHRVVNALVSQCFPDGLVRKLLLEPRGDDRAALEVDAEVESLSTGRLPDDRRSQTKEHEQQRHADKSAPVTQPVNFDVVQNLKHDESLNTQRLHSLAGQQPDKDRARNVDR